MLWRSRLPIAVIGQLLGVPRADQPQFERLARVRTRVLDVTTPRAVARANRATAEIRSYLGDPEPGPRRPGSAPQPTGRP